MNTNPLTQRFGMAMPQKKPMSPAEAAAELLRRQQQQQAMVNKNSVPPPKYPPGMVDLSDPNQFDLANAQVNDSAQGVPKPKPDLGQAAVPIASAAAPHIANAVTGSAPVSTTVGASYPATSSVINGSTAAANSSPLPGAMASSPVPPQPGIFAPGGPALQAAGVVGGAGVGYEQGQSAIHQFKGEKPSLIEAAASFPVDFGASFANLVGQDLGLWGHTKNYSDGKNREKFLGDNPLTVKGGDGNDITITGKDFRKDPNTYNYDQSQKTMAEDIGAAQALAYLKTGQKPGEKLFNDVAGMFAKLHSKGVSANDLYKTEGFDYGSARDAIEKSDLPQETKDAFYNGLDQAFGVNAYGKPSSKIPPRKGGGSSGGGGHSAEPPKASPTPIDPRPTNAPVVPGTTSNTQPVTQPDYSAAIQAVNEANQSEAPVLRKRNPLMRKPWQ